MSVPPARQPDVLMLLADPESMRPLREHLQGLGMQIDVAADLPSAHAAFFRAGGHDCLVIGPNVRPGIAQHVFRSLRSIDPDLATASFGARSPNHPRPTRWAGLGAFHPGSRAGTGALLRFLRSLTPRKAP